MTDGLMSLVFIIKIIWDVERRGTRTRMAGLLTSVTIEVTAFC